MYPIALVEWAEELLAGASLAGSRVNTDAPACQTGAPNRLAFAATMSTAWTEAGFEASSTTVKASFSCRIGLAAT